METFQKADLTDERSTVLSNLLKGGASPIKILLWGTEDEPLDNKYDELLECKN